MKNSPFSPVETGNGSWWRVTGLQAGLYLLVICLVVNWWIPWIHGMGNFFDEALLLVGPEMVLNGRWPYRDFSSFYGPANFWVLAAVYKVLGVSLAVERSVGMAYRCGYLLALAWLGRRLAPGWGWLLPVLGLLAIAPLNLDATAWIPACTASLFSVLVASKSSLKAGEVSEKSGWLFGSGVLAAVALLFRPDMGLAIGLAGLAILLPWSWPKRKIWMLGFGMGLLPLLFSAWVVSWKLLWLELFYFPVLQSGPGRRLPFSSLESGLRESVVLLLLIMVCHVATAGYHLWRSREEAGARLYFSMSLLGMGMAPQMLQRCDAFHIAMGTMVILPLLVVTVRQWLLFFKIKTIWPGLGSVAFILILGLLPATKGYREAVRFQVGLVTGKLQYNVLEVVCDGRSFLVGAGLNPTDSQKVVNFLRAASRPGQTLFVGQGDVRRSYQNDVYLYHLLLPRLRPGTYFIDLNPMMANARNSGLEDQLEKCDWVVLNRLWDQPKEPNRSQEIGYDGPARVLSTQFTPVFRAGTFGVWRNHRTKL